MHCHAMFSQIFISLDYTLHLPFGYKLYIYTYISHIDNSVKVHTSSIIYNEKCVD